MPRSIRDEEAARNLLKLSWEPGSLGEGSILACLLCGKHCAFKYVPIVCTCYIYTQLCICYVRHYASERIYLCMFICMYVHVCMSAQGH